MFYIYRDRILYLGTKRYLLEWCEEQPFLQNLDTGEKTNIKMIDVSNFFWIKNKVEYHLKIDRSTKRPAKEKVWKVTGYKKPDFEEIWECECTVSTKKVS